MKGIIPTGGRGTRMRPITFSANKHLLPVGNKPLIFYPLQTLAQAGITEIAITYNPGQLPPVESLLGDGSQWGLHLTYVLQPEPKGLADIVRVCEDYLAGDSFIFHLGDNIFVDGLDYLITYFTSHKPNGLLGTIHHRQNSRMGVPFFDSLGKLIKYVEKPKTVPHDLAIPGVYLADHHFFDSFTGSDQILPSARGEYEITGPYQWLIDHHFQVDTTPIKGKWLDPGKFDDWLDANRYLLTHQTAGQISSPLPKSVKLTGLVDIGKNCHISSTTIVGPVNIGDNVAIADSVIGPHVSVFHGSTIKSSKISNSVLMESVSLSGFTKPIDTSIIGPHSSLAQNNRYHGKSRLFVGELCQMDL